MIKAQNNPNYKTLKCASAFSGIGAVEQALKNIGVSHTNEFMIEIDKFARQTFLENHSVNNVFEDVTAVDTKNLPDMDLFTFGSPCQSFSQQGKRMGMEDTRGTLIYNGLKVIQDKQPKHFIYENVGGLVNHDKGNTFKVIKSAFEELNYNIQYQIMNAKNFGAAQNRERLFIVGIRKDIKQTFEFPQPKPVSNCVNNYISTAKDIKYKLYDASNRVDFYEARITDIKKLFVLPHLKFQSDKRIISTDGISPCLTSQGSKTKFYDTKNKLYRYLTEDEQVAIQGFPPKFIFPVSKTQQRKQLGNSIYVGVLEEILSSLLSDYIPTKEVSRATLKPANFIHWMGGKQRLLPVLREKVPANFNNYFEPFVGGGALLLELAPNQAHISDMNEELILTYKVIKHNVEELITELNTHKFNEDYYNNIRSLDRNAEEFSKLADTKRASRFIYLTKTGFNGLWRVNQKNQNNVGYNKKDKNIDFGADNLRMISQKLQNMTIEYEDFTAIKKEIKRGDFIYLDPPYLNSTQNYTKEGFSLEKHIELKELCDYINSVGAYFLLSNSNNETTRELYNSFNIDYVDMRQNINPDKSKRENTKEILVSNYTNKAVNSPIFNAMEVA